MTRAIIGCAIEDRPGHWFVQLREPSHDLFEQRVISTTWGDTKAEAVAQAMQHGGVTEIVGEWPVYAAQKPSGVLHPSPFVRQMVRLSRALG